MALFQQAVLNKYLKEIGDDEITGVWVRFTSHFHNLKVELSLSKEAEWMEYFNKQKAKSDALKTQITQTDSEIDPMVYELYGLSEEEVKAVEKTKN